MRIKKASYILIFILVFISTFHVYAENLNYSLSSEKSYTFSESYIIKNTGSAVIKNANIEVFGGTSNEFPYQKDLDISYSPKPNTFKEDKFGNRIAIYSVSKLLPGENLEIEVSRKVISYDIKYKLDSLSINSTNLDNSALKLFLNEDDKIESGNNKIIAKAKTLTQGLDNNYSKSKEIFRFVNSYMTYDDSDTYRNKGALSALITARGVCEDYATLFAALCRASGIPARVVTGFRFNDSSVNFNPGEWNNIDKYGHAWAEYYIEGYGWIPVEVTQLYTINGIKEVYWDGFSNLESSKYIATGFYSPSTKALSISYYYEAGSNPQLDWEPAKVMIKVDTIPDSDFITASKQINPDFTDLTPTHWAYDYVSSAFNKGIIKGYQDKTFKPNNNVSRIEFLAMLSRMLKYINYKTSNNTTSFVFSDYPSNHWSKNDYDYLTQCFEKAEPSDGKAGQTTLTRVFDDKLQPDQLITREEAVALFDKFLKDSYKYDESFSDIDSSKFRLSILKAYKDNLINGYSQNKFKPRNNITRAEAAKLFDTYLRNE